MKENADILEKNMQEYSKKYPGDNMSVMYAIFNTHKETYYRALFFKVFNCMMRIAQDLLFFRFIAELENGKGAFTQEEMVFPAMLQARKIGMTQPATRQLLQSPVKTGGLIHLPMMMDQPALPHNACWAAVAAVATARPRGQIQARFQLLGRCGNRGNCSG